MFNCSICSDGFGVASPFQALTPGFENSGGSKVSATQCGHLYHTACILKWMNSGRSRIQCPVCKEKISKQTIITIYQEWPAPGTIGQFGGFNHPPQEQPVRSGENKALELLENQKTDLIKEIEELRERNIFLTLENEKMGFKVQEFFSVHEQNVAALQCSRAEKEQLSQKYIALKHELQRHKCEYNKLKRKLNYHNGIEAINQLENADSNEESTLLKNFQISDPEQQLSLVTVLEKKCKDFFNQRRTYLKMYQDEKKRARSLEEELNRLEEDNLLLKKKVQAGENYQEKPNVRPSSSATPEPKIPRLASTNPFLRRVIADPQPKKLKRSATPPSNPRDDLGNGFEALSLEPDIILIDDSPNPPTRRRLNPRPELNTSHRDIHGFYT